MRRFLRKTLLFLLPLAVLAVPLDYAISYFLKNSHEEPGELEVMNDIYNGKAGCDIAVYGSSRAWVHFNTQTMEDSLHETVYNFGVDGHNFWMQYLRHLEFVKHNKWPKLIIVSVDMFTLQKRADLYQLNQFLPFMLWNKNVKDFTSSYTGFTKADYDIPLLRYMGRSSALNSSVKTAISDVLGNSEMKPYRTRGFRGMDRKWNADFEKARAAKTGYETKLDSSTIALLENFVKECRSVKTKVIFIYAPEYIEGQKFVVNRDKIINIYKELSEKYNLLFLDYSADKISFDQSLFYNANHMNKQGADLFTNKVIAELKARTHNGVFDDAAANDK